LDQPVTALEFLQKASLKYPNETSFILHIARVQDQLNQSAAAITNYQRILAIESSNIEAVASIAAYHFYLD
jgi:tetratricopeptide repeat protein 8